MTFFRSLSFLLVFFSWFVVEGRFLKRGGSSRGGGTRGYHGTRTGGSSSNNSDTGDADGRWIPLVIILTVSLTFAVLPLLFHCVWRKHGQAKTMEVTSDKKSPRDEQDPVQIDVNDEQEMETTTDTESTGTAPLPNDGDLVRPHPNTRKRSSSCTPAHLQAQHTRTRT